MLVKVGKGIELDVDVEALPPKALEHVIKMGLRNILMDSHASVVRDDFKDDDDGHAAWIAKAEEVVNRKLTNLYNGEIRPAVAERETDPVRAMALDIATRLAKDEWKKTAKRGDKFENPRSHGSDYLESHPEIMDTVRGILGVA